MDWKQFFASAIENLAWPITVAVMFFFVREQIGKLIEKLGKLKYKDLELDFSKIKQQIPATENLKNDEEVKKGLAIIDRESKQVFSALEEQIFEAVDSSPAVSILLAWSYVETALSSAVSRADSELDKASASPLKNIQLLERGGKLSLQQLELLQEMRTLRNKLAHEVSSELNIHPEQALDYANTAIEMARFLEGIDRKRKIFMLPQGEWVTLPEGFSEVSERRANFWKYSCISIPKTDLTAGVGPWSAGKDQFQYFGIDIEQQRKDRSTVVTELIFDLSYVSEEKLLLSASNLVSFDEESRIVRFDLGKAIFEYQLQ
jgi:uncharacterized protein YutE (UPF0331/DUF86 family)